MVGEERKSMFNWNETFKDEGSQYFTLLVLKRFAKLHRTAYLKPSLDRVSLIDNISIYANESSQNEEDVKTWIDDCMREGRRDIYIQKYDKDFVSDRMLMNESSPNLCVHSSSSYVSPSMLPLSSGDLIEWSLVCHSTLSYQKFCDRHSNHYDHPEELHQSVE